MTARVKKVPPGGPMTAGEQLVCKALAERLALAMMPYTRVTAVYDASAPSAPSDMLTPARLRAIFHEIASLEAENDAATTERYVWFLRELFPLNGLNSGEFIDGTGEVLARLQSGR